MNPHEFEHMIVSHSFINASVPEMMEQMGNISAYLKASKPYSEDKALMKLLDALTNKILTTDSNLALRLQKRNILVVEKRKELKGSGQLNQSEIEVALSSIFPLDEPLKTAMRNQAMLEHDLKDLCNYFNRLAAVGVDKPILHVPLIMEDKSNPKNVGVNQNINFLLAKDTDKDDKRNLANQMNELNAEGISRYIPVRGDGNCYYRSVMLGFMLQAITANGEVRKEKFNHLAELIEKTAIPLVKSGEKNTDIGYSNEAEQKHALKDLAKMFRLAAENKMLKSPDELFRRFDEPGNLFDKQLMVMSRGLTAADFTDKVKNNIQINGLPIEFAMDNETPQHYCDKKILTLGVDAQGIQVNTGFLPHLLRMESTINIVSRDDNTPLSVVESKEGESVDITINMMLRRGHYDLLLTKAQHEAIRRSELDHAQILIQQKTQSTKNDVSQIAEKLQAEEAIDFEKAVQASMQVQNEKNEREIEEAVRQIDNVYAKQQQLEDEDDFYRDEVLKIDNVHAVQQHKDRVEVSFQEPQDVFYESNIAREQEKWYSNDDDALAEGIRQSLLGSANEFCAIAGELSTLQLGAAQDKIINKLCESLINRTELLVQREFKEDKGKYDYNKDINNLLATAEKALKPSIWQKYIAPIIIKLMRPFVAQGYEALQPARPKEIFEQLKSRLIEQKNNIKDSESALENITNSVSRPFRQR